MSENEIKPYIVDRAYVTRTRGLQLELFDGTRSIVADVDRSILVDPITEAITIEGVRYNFFSPDEEKRLRRVGGMVLRLSGEAEATGITLDPSRLAVTLHAIDISYELSDANEPRESQQAFVREIVSLNDQWLTVQQPNA